MAHKLALLGFGGVGQGLVHILREKHQRLKETYGCEFVVVSISDLYKGSLHHPEGLDLDRVIEAIEKTGSLDYYPDQLGLVRGWSSEETIQKTNAKTIVEMTFTDIKTGQPAISHCQEAFKHGKHVVMTNKGPVALAHKELAEQAKENGVRWLFEGAVMSGTPALRLPLATLAGNDITSIKGILNGTTNYMLTKMEEEGLDYDDVLKEAQELGYAEADPTSDVEGYDVLYKVLILSEVVLGMPLKREDVELKGISSISIKEIEAAKKEGKRWKLIGRLEQTESGLKASVKPEKLDLSDPLAGIGGATNAITYTCDLSGPITLVGAGAGIKETGFAVLIDLIQLERKQI
ncbi:homoserine dehydrogenase [Halalkalibacter urbisdiaboli]|uniref:homoserine dehydrogenase n=1 Tax=Halalkalibacter urbisdiaboli TaxID=1960589 RepID=UPI000B44F90B|nr:homoserine dehydrogenase [Halalkalibacter urbisdiaboli]